MIPNFRAWDKVEKKMCYVDAIWFRSNIALLRSGTFRFERLFNRVEFMQSIGIKDINGVDIYEGDIVENSHKKIGFIKNCNDAFCFNRKEYNFYLSGIGAGSPFKILGNIYQHPELLEDE